MPIESHNPATGKTLATFEELNAEQIERRLALAQTTFETWRFVPLAQRSKLLLSLAQVLRANAAEMADIAAQEMGKPVAAGKAEVEKCAWACEYYAENAEEFLKPEQVKTDASQSYVRFDPLGVILAVMPWNFPYWQVLRFAAPAVLAGNVALLKHASSVPQCGMAIEKAFTQAGFPEGVFENLLIGASKVEGLIRDPRIKAVTLTGSEPAGQKVASVAGHEIKKTVLELGGSDPFIVLADADIEKAASVAAVARLQNCGQSCISAKRFIVVKEVAEEFINKFKQYTEKMVVGDPLDPKTQVGPLANKSGLQDIEKQVSTSVSLGAEVVTGGQRLTGAQFEHGYFYAPTIIRDIKKGMPLYHEETFGPVASVFIAENTDDAIRIANDTTFGLGSSLWTRDIKLAEQLASKINAGCVFINGLVKSDPRLPFGGINRSGYGRELSHYGLREFVNVKTVWVA